MNYKRKKCKRRVRCAICTSDRFGNSPESFKPKDVEQKRLAKKDIKDILGGGLKSSHP